MTNELNHALIFVYISDGVGRTGSFITMYSQIERAKVEGIVDVFQFIRRARTQRQGLVRDEVCNYI